MTEEQKTTEQTNVEKKPETTRRRFEGGARGGDDKKMRRGRRDTRRKERVKPEFDHKIISIRRVARVVAGGRRFAFSVTLVAGNKKGSVGVGLGKAGDTALAIEKAFRDAKKRMITIPLTKNRSIPYDVQAKYASSTITIAPAPDRGLIAGSSVRTVLEFAGVTDVTSKILTRSKNQLNIARATITALEPFTKKVNR
ncbi:MAG: 30S ribosomal protein S5 [Candidatus Paceibacterota bacterium]